MFWFHSALIFVLVLPLRSFLLRCVSFSLSFATFRWGVTPRNCSRGGEGVYCVSAPRNCYCPRSRGPPDPRAARPPRRDAPEVTAATWELQRRARRILECAVGEFCASPECAKEGALQLLAWHLRFQDGLVLAPREIWTM